MSFIISISAFIISIVTFYLTRIKKGTIKMTRPTTIYFGGDGSINEKKNNKVYLKTLLFNNSDRGRIIQNMYVRLQRGESIQVFNIWVHDSTGKLARGSGLFVDKRGLDASHHFFLPKNNQQFAFLSGDYTLEVYVEILNEKPTKIFEQKLTVTKDQEEKLKDNITGLYYDWATNDQTYFAHIMARKLTSEEYEILLM